MHSTSATGESEAGASSACRLASSAASSTRTTLISPPARLRRIHRLLARKRGVAQPRGPALPFFIFLLLLDKFAAICFQLILEVLIVFLSS